MFQEIKHVTLTTLSIIDSNRFTDSDCSREDVGFLKVLTAQWDLVFATSVLVLTFLSSYSV